MTFYDRYIFPVGLVLCMLAVMFAAGCVASGSSPEHPQYVKCVQ